MADTPTREELHAALRRCTLYCIDTLPAGAFVFECRECGGQWLHKDQPERHALGCLAAPDALTKGDENE